MATHSNIVAGRILWTKEPGRLQSMRSQKSDMTQQQQQQCIFWGDFPGGTSDKEPACQWRKCERQAFNPWLGRSPGEGHGIPFQYSCLENPMDKGAWQAT